MHLDDGFVLLSNNIYSVAILAQERRLNEFCVAMQASSSSHAVEAGAKRKRKGGCKKRSERIRRLRTQAATAAEGDVKADEKLSEEKWLRAGNKKKKKKRAALARTLVRAPAFSKAFSKASISKASTRGPAFSKACNQQSQRSTAKKQPPSVPPQTAASKATTLPAGPPMLAVRIEATELPAVKSAAFSAVKIELPPREPLVPTTVPPAPQIGKAIPMVFPSLAQLLIVPGLLPADFPLPAKAPPSMAAVRFPFLVPPVGCPAMREVYDELMGIPPPPLRELNVPP